MASVGGPSARCPAPGAAQVGTSISPSLLAKCEELGILVDKDEKGVLLQIFTKPLGGWCGRGLGGQVRGGAGGRAHAGSLAQPTCSSSTMSTSSVACMHGL